MHSSQVKLEVDFRNDSVPNHCAYKGTQVKLEWAQEWFSHLDRPAGAHGLAHMEGALLSSDEPENNLDPGNTKWGSYTPVDHSVDHVRVVSSQVLRAVLCMFSQSGAVVLCQVASHGLASVVDQLSVMLDKQYTPIFEVFLFSCSCYPKRCISRTHSSQAMPSSVGWGGVWPTAMEMVRLINKRGNILIKCR